MGLKGGMGRGWGLVFCGGVGGGGGRLFSSLGWCVLNEEKGTSEYFKNLKSINNFKGINNSPGTQIRVVSINFFLSFLYF